MSNYSKVIDTITNELEVLITEALIDSDYQPLNFVSDISLNKFQNNSKRYGILTGSAQEVTGTVSHITMDQTFNVFLTDTWSYGGQNQLNDKFKREQTLKLIDRCMDIYNHIASKRNYIDADVLNVSSLVVNTPSYLDESNVIIQQMSFSLLHRVRSLK